MTTRKQITNVWTVTAVAIVIALGMSIPASAIPITPVATKYSNVYSANRVPDNLFNATGMDDTETFLYNLNGTISGEPTGPDGVLWMTSNTDTNAVTQGRVWIVIDLGASYALGNLDIWNVQWSHASGDLSNRGISQFDVFVRNTDADTDDGTGGGTAINVSGQGTSIVTAPVFNLGTSDQWQVALSDQPLAQAPNNDTYTATTFDLVGNLARFVAIRVDSGYGGSTFGIGKIRIASTNPGTLIYGK